MHSQLARVWHTSTWWQQQKQKPYKGISITLWEYISIWEEQVLTFFSIWHVCAYVCKYEWENSWYLYYNRVVCFVCFLYHLFFFSIWLCFTLLLSVCVVLWFFNSLLVYILIMSRFFGCFSKNIIFISTHSH